MVGSISTPFRVLLVSTYELGRQPFGLASPAAWLQRLGASVRCVDLSRTKFEEYDFQAADSRCLLLADAYRDATGCSSYSKDFPIEPKGSTMRLWPLCIR